MDKYKITAQIIRKVKKGELVRLSHCELCNVQCVNSYGEGATVAHHANGYDKPFDVWWICCRCNVVLRGEYFHSGQVTKEEAREFVNSKPRSDVYPKSKVHFLIKDRIFCGEPSPYCTITKNKSEVTCKKCMRHASIKYANIFSRP